MERELWKLIIAAMKRLPRTRSRNAVYSDSEVLAVLLWAVLHDRPISWACVRRHWPPQAWRRRLPDQSTMSRRLRTDATRDQLAVVLTHVQASLPPWVRSLHRVKLWLSAKLIINAARLARMAEVHA